MHSERFIQYTVRMAELMASSIYWPKCTVMVEASRRPAAGPVCLGDLTRGVLAGQSVVSARQSPVLRGTSQCCGVWRCTGCLSPTRELPSAAAMRLLLHSARQVVQVCSDGQLALRGAEMGRLAVLDRPDGGLAVAVDSDGKIAAIGSNESVLAAYPESSFEQVMDVSGQVLLPGLVDAHTHPVWAGDRVNEFAMKLAGASYMEVHQAGGGINFTVEKTRAASEETLLKALLPRLQRMISTGTTLAECKSGYGLDTETEVKMLRVLEAARPRSAVELSSTFCGAHSVPKGKTSSEATDTVIDGMLPEIKRLRDLGELSVDSIDVFCEKGVFSVEETSRILRAGKDQGLLLNFHGEELCRLNSAEMGAGLGAAAISHLEHVSPEGIGAMAAAGTVAVILPTTAYILRLVAPPVRDMIAAGAAVALGTDFNPNAYCLSMPLVMHLACVNLRMTMAEALSAATINAAASLGRAASHGSLEVGKQADLLVLDAPSWKHLIYQFGEAAHIISHVIKRGRVVHSRPASATAAGERCQY
ncbi:probable imidazolonepropionase [Pollicipes pollicipes]|uniref:probable imidazolonepropionase n=1 Tax=Pollicipes pollicipes TaxID=41117 RepID=UPI0018850E03|nr:probable imidazolonepropionase [Pollicipes pollicipes]